MAKIPTSAYEDAIKTVTSGVKSAIKGESILHSNKAINHIADNYFGVGEVAHKVLKGNMGIKEAAVRTFATNADDLFTEAGERTLTKATMNYGKIAGSYIGAGVAARVVTGGGVYKDRNGNTNLVGVPFV